MESAVNGVPKRARGAGRIPDAAPLRPALRRDLGEDFAPRRRSLAGAIPLIDGEEDFVPRRRMGGLRFRLAGGLPRGWAGRLLLGAIACGVVGAMTVGLWEARAELLKSPRLVLSSSAGIQISGNSHLTRAQLLTVFGEDVDRNLMTVPLAERRAELERLPWVEHATVMRLLPDRVRVEIVERRPVAFVRQGSTIGLVDASGVLLDMASDGDAPAESHYSFPVVTGLSADEPLSTRGARMKIFRRFMADLAERSKTVSEVDLSNPEDVKALVLNGGSGVLVHFGSEDFLHRYDLFARNLPGWLREYPRLASADMRYERQVVLEMQPGAPVPVEEVAAKEVPPDAAEVRPALKAKAKVAAVAKPKPAPAPAATVAAAAAVAAPARHLDQAFDVPAVKKPKPAVAVAR